MRLEHRSQRRRADILKAALVIFGHSGFTKASIDEIADAAGISKQGLYLHFKSKEELFVESLVNYLEERLREVEHVLASPKAGLRFKLERAFDVWFGRHRETFSPQSHDVSQTGDELSEGRTYAFRQHFKDRIAACLLASPEFFGAGDKRMVADTTEVLFLCGLTWKYDHADRESFRRSIRRCIRVCCRLN